MSDRTDAERGPLPGMGWTKGLIGREALAGRPILVSMAIIFLVGPFLAMLLDLFTQGTVKFPRAVDMAQWWGIVLMVAAFVSGVLCGAEETETGTAEYVRCLPLSPTRILMEKILGSMLGLFLFSILSLAGMALLNPILVKSHGIGFLGSLFSGGTLPFHILWAATFYFCSMACGAWIGRVLPTAILSGILSVAVLYPILQFVSGHIIPWRGFWHTSGLPVVLVGALCSLAFLITALRYWTRESSLSAAFLRVFRTSGGIESKDWRRRRWMLVGLALLISLAYPLGVKILPTFPIPGMLVSTGLAVILSGYLLGITLMENEEYHPADGLIYALPIDRRRIWREKLRTLLWQWALLALLAVVFFLLWRVVTKIPNSGGMKWSANLVHSIYFGPLILAASLAVMFYGACLSMYIRSKIVLLVAGPALLCLLGFLVVLQVVRPWFLMAIFWSQDFYSGRSFHQATWQLLFPMQAGNLVRMLILAVGLAFWLRCLIRRGALQEMSPFLRIQFALFFAIVLTVGYTLFMMCNYRDLMFLLFGI